MIEAFATKRYKASAAYAAVKAALPTKKRQRTPVADCDQYFLRKKGTKHPRHRHGFLATFDTKKYKVPRGRRPRLTADQKRQTTPVADCDRYFLRPKSTSPSAAKTAVILVPPQARMRRLRLLHVATGRERLRPDAGAVKRRPG